MAPRIPFNLATHRVERVRAARRFITLAGALLLVLTVVHLAVYSWVTTPDASAAVETPAIDPAQMAAWQTEVDQLVRVADIERARIAAGSVRIGNELVGWRTIPWREIFADLEEVLPLRVRLEIVAPSVTAGGGIEIQMTAAARDTGPLQDLMLALEAHHAFADVWPQREDSGIDQFTRLTLRASYVPQPGSSAAATLDAEIEAVGEGE
jgi:Tfp pilus assembly protein PilN